MLDEGHRGNGCGTVRDIHEQHICCLREVESLLRSLCREEGDVGHAELSSASLQPSVRVVGAEEEVDRWTRRRCNAIPSGCRMQQVEQDDAQSGGLQRDTHKEANANNNSQQLLH